MTSRSSIKLAYIDTPLGVARVKGTEKGISEVSILDEDQEHSQEVPTELKACCDQLTAYFQGELKEFDLEFDLEGTPFQQKIWKQLLTIPFGVTSTYTEQSDLHGDLKAIRAVGHAIGRNPLWIIIPCHRVVGSNGELRGYAGGLWRKKWLLEHESPPSQIKLF